MATKTNQANTDPQFLRTRQMATFLPVVVVPFLACMFMLLGGGEGRAEASNEAVSAGLNTEIPAAEERKIYGSKLEAYEQPLDSSRNSRLVSEQGGLAMGLGKDGQPTGPMADADAQNALAQQQLLEMQRSQIEANQAATASAAMGGSGGGGGSSEAQATREFEMQMKQMQLQHQQELEMAKLQIEAETRREMQMKLAERESQRQEKQVLEERNNPPKPETNASISNTDAVVTHLGSSGKSKGKARFHSLSNKNEAAPSNMLPAVIHESQEVVSGGLVKLRLTKDCVVNGRTIPANSFIYATAGLSGERLTLSIETMKAGGDIFPVALEVYDLDGLTGLHIPGAITRDAAKQAGASGISSVGSDMMMVNPTLATQAAGVAIETVKQLGSQKIRLVKVRLKAGYKVLLKPDENKN